MTVPRGTGRFLTSAMAIFCAMALVLSAVMFLHALSGIGLYGCGVGSSCDDVLSSKWSLLFGTVPISAPAILAYAAFLICLWAECRDTDGSLGELPSEVMLAVCGAVSASAVWFIYIQKFKIGAFCPYCMSAHTAGLLLSAATVIRAAADKRLTTLRTTASFLTGALAAAVLISLQLALLPEYSYGEGYIPASLPEPKEEMMPCVGDPQAQMRIMLLYDYQCSHCRSVHMTLDEITERFGGKVCFLLCPTPLSHECNYYVPRTDTDRFKGSCDLARLALAVWISDREIFGLFDSWLFSPTSPEEGWYPKSVDEARRMAASLIGDESLNAALVDSRINEAIGTFTEVFGRTVSDGKGGIPKMILNGKWLIPETDSADELYKLIETSLIGNE